MTGTKKNESFGKNGVVSSKNKFTSVKSNAVVVSVPMDPVQPLKLCRIHM